MSTIKSFSVGYGDMFFINHGSDNFTIIDCCYEDETQRDKMFRQIKELSRKKGITRFISTHPDEDHIKGLDTLDDLIGILNFYVVKNEAIREDETCSFRRYCELRDDSKKAFYVQKGCKRRWMNQESEDNDGMIRKSSGIDFLWPDLSNKYFKEVLDTVKTGNGMNNISPIFTYSLSKGIKALWMGDIENDFLGKIKSEIRWPRVDVLFAPHHGRKSGHVCSDVLDLLSPKVIVLGEAPSKDLDYYCGYSTIKQNSAGDISFCCSEGIVDVYVENYNYRYEVNSLFDNGLPNTDEGKYIGSFIPFAAE